MDLGGDMGIDPAHVPSPPFHHHTGRARMWSPRGHWRDHPQPARGSRGAPDSSAPPAGWPDGPTGRIADWLDGGRLSRAQKPIEGLCGTSRYPWEEPLLGEGARWADPDPKPQVAKAMRSLAGRPSAKGPGSSAGR